MKFIRKNSNITSNQQRGQHAEKFAKQYLQQQGLRFITQNYHSRFGEIDLIMKETKTIIFIEVRCRRANAQVTALESISPQKIKKIRKTAEFFLLDLDTIPPCRFDVIAMSYTSGNSDYNIEWIKDAF
ncbi:MAG: YraN family protein [Gammaproteobacteria bacterium]|nr:YraN family protein [Gammaproteobacteria bacterium]